MAHRVGGRVVAAAVAVVAAVLAAVATGGVTAGMAGATPAGSAVRAGSAWPDVPAFTTGPASGAGAVGTAGPADPGMRPRVVGGQSAAPGQFPWVVRLSMGCGGTVVTARVVLTAAHCVSGTGADNQIVATIGRTTLSAGGGQTIRSSYVVRSPRYSQLGTVDWALVELARPTSAPPLGMIGQGDTSASRVALTVLGWGATAEGGPQSDTLQFATVPFVDDTTCTRSYRNQFKPQTELCAGYPQGGVDTCQGDSGGPMVADVRGRVVQVGIVSYGLGCARPGYPGVYAELDAFSAEIASHLGPQGQLLP